MIKRLDHKFVTGLKIRLVSALRCLTYKKFILVAWKKADDVELDYRISHKGCPVDEAVHRLKVDAVEILQDIEDQNSAVDATRDILK